MPAGSDCASGDVSGCWAGLGNPPPQNISWIVSLDGAPMSRSRPLASQLGDGGGFYALSAGLDVLLDGSVAQVYLNGDVTTKSALICSDSGASLTLSGGESLLHLDAWRMATPSSKTDDGELSHRAVPCTGRRASRRRPSWPTCQGTMVLIPSAGM